MDRRLQEKKLEADKENLRRQEEIDLVRSANQRRMQREVNEAEKEQIALEQEKFKLQQEAMQERIEIEAPVQQYSMKKNQEALQVELALRQLENQVKELRLNGNMMEEVARQRLKEQILPLEQAPDIIGAASHIFQGANLSIYGSESQWAAMLQPIIEVFARTVQRAIQSSEARPPEAVE